MLKNKQLLCLLLFVLGVTTFFITARLVYSQVTTKAKEDKLSGTQNKFSKLAIAVGQWNLYEVSINQLSDPSKKATYLFRTSIVGEEKIKGEQYFWEEVSLGSEGLLIKSLKKPGDSRVKKVIFQRKNMTALEIDPVEIGRQLNIPPNDILPEFYQPLVKGVSKNLSLKNIISQTNTAVYNVPSTKEDLACRELVLNDIEKGGQIIIWLCEQIPLTGFCKISYIGKESIISVKLVNFGFKSAISEISGLVLKFGDTSKGSTDK